MLVSVFCFGWGLLQVIRLIERHHPRDGTATRAIVLMAAYPFAVFFGAAYSESLFLLLMASTVLAWYRGDLRAAALCGVLTGLARSNGWTLSLALLVGLFAEHETRDRTSRRVLAALGPVIGAGLFSAYCWHLTGNPFEWIRAQESWGRHVSLVSFVTRRWHAVETTSVVGYLTADPVDAATFVAIIGVAGMCVYWALRRRWLYATLLAGYLAPAVAIDLPATGRMTSVLFPAFMGIAASIRGRWFVALAILFALGEAFMAGRHYLWLPPY